MLFKDKTVCCLRLNRYGLEAKKQICPNSTLKEEYMIYDDGLNFRFYIVVVLLRFIG